MSATPADRAPRRPWAALVALAVALAAFAAAPGADAARGTPDRVLLRTYQPFLVFHPTEQFRPTKVQGFIADAVLQRFVGSSPAQLPHDAFWADVTPDPGPGGLPAATPGVFYRLDHTGCEADAPLAGRDCYAAAAADGGGGEAVYGRVARTDTRIVLQYWLFYEHNPLLLPATPFGVFWQSHEGDWELVNVVLDLDGRPVEAAYSQHCTGARRPWSEVEKRPAGGTHPVAYVALGSHANFFAPGPGPLGGVPIDPACIPPAVAAALPLLPFLQVVDQVVDGTAAGAVVGPPGSGVDAASIHKIEGTAWSLFGGRWGESEYFHSPLALGPVPAGVPVAVGLAPASPPHQAAWNPSTVFGWPAG